MIAHLFLTNADLFHDDLWARFFAGSSSPIYCAAQHPELVAGFLRPHLVAGNWRGKLGTFDIMQIELELLRTALKGPAEFFSLHSESCVPLRTHADTERIVSDINKSWMIPLQASMKRRPSNIQTEHFYKCEQWFLLTRKHAEYIVSCDAVSWRDSENADEHFIPTMLSTAGMLADCHSHWTTAADWSTGDGHPRTFDQVDDVNSLRESGFLFARKYSTTSNISNYLPVQ